MLDNDKRYEWEQGIGSEILQKKTLCDTEAPRWSKTWEITWETLFWKAPSEWKNGFYRLKSPFFLRRWKIESTSAIAEEQMNAEKNSYRTHWKIRSIALTVVQNQTGKWEKCTERKNTINPQSHELHLTLVNSSVSLLRFVVTLVEPNGKWSSGYLFLA